MIDEQYSGGVFNEQLPSGRAGAEITLATAAIEAITPTGERFAIPYRDCQIEMGGFNNRMVFCRNPDRTVTIFCDHKKFSKSLSTAACGVLDNQLGASKQQMKRQSRRGMLFGTACLVGILVLLVGGYFGIRFGASAAIHALPVSVDRQIGDAAYASMDTGGPEINDPVVVSAIETMVERLEPHAAVEAMEFEVHVIDSPMMNAFCLPGGVIVVYTGLIKQAEDPEQVAAVLAHEMSHATLRHGLERISQSLGFWAAATLVIGDVSGLMAAGAELFHYAAVNSYSRGQEDAADAEGVRMLHAAGIDPSGMARFFEILEEEHGDIPDALAWISTHPQHADRIESVNAIVETLPNKEYTPIDVDWEQVQARATKRPNPQGDG
ncbi:M48 family metallopeptidase [Roseiconus lacunae]|uniref:M48 family metallopeptidase n=1 Tax=Roseiconus lacunae TaxID=2605694 RepID=UPI001F3B76FB|nr:M48 family metallopeptidase [Roseiconus lacunae]WRQ50871.1 M48 family metallopeptidase [Stieleria sp. HD01]